MGPLKNLLLATSFLLLLVASATAQARTVYFFPPEDAAWIAGKSYISDMVRAVPLSVDPTRCGWYKAVFDASNPIPRYSQFWLGASGVDKIGDKGRQSIDFDDNTDPTELGRFLLENKFEELNSANIYLVADELDPASPNAGWYAKDPQISDPSRCSFKLATFIYDTDKDVNSSFTEYTDDLGAGGDLYGDWSSGILKGMVKSNLNPSTRKIECDKCTGSPGAFNSQADFEAAFKDYAKGNPSAKNVKLCYDMPFSQVAGGNFEFDSDEMRNHSNKLVGGFFPEVLQNSTLGNAAVVPGSADYEDCQKCNTKRKAESFVNLTKRINPYCFERGYETKAGYATQGSGANGYTVYVTPCNSSIAACCGAAYGQVKGPDGELSHFANGNWPANTWGMTRAGDMNQGGWSADWNPNWRDSTLNLWGDTGCGRTGASENKTCKANEHFCAESHASFVYDPEHEFFFRGDDDIWVYINNKLVIDLGGVHMAAPGHVKLSELGASFGLTAGESYPIDIFFCDRRTSMSNIRISTNIYVAQKSAFYQDLEKTQNTICAAISGSDCASKMSGGTDMCGSQLTSSGYTVDFYMVDRDTKDTVYLSPARGNQVRYEGCKGDNKAFECNGANGITVTNAVYTCGGRGQCKGNPDAQQKVGITGSYNVYARLMGADGKQVAGSKTLLIDSFMGDATPTITRSFINNIKASSNAGTILLENLPTGAKVEVYNLQGKLIYTSGKSLNRENLGSDNLRIPVQTKGVYIIKVSLGSKILTFNRSIYE